MFKGLTHDVKIVVISVAVSSLVVGVPAAAAVYANNSDKVDGKHAVGAKASVDKRAGKLVATDKQGVLPNDIILQAMDSDLLDGLSSTDFLAADGTATNAELLGGQAPSEFLGADDKALDADKLDGFDSTDFLGATGKATDADKLDGVDSSVFTRGGGTTRATVVTAAANTWTYRTVTTGGASGFAGTWAFRCPVDPATTAAQMQFYAGDLTDVYVTRLGSTGTWYQSVPAGDWMFIRDAAPIDGNNGDIFSWSFVNATKNLVVTAQTTSRRTANGCTFTSRATETPATS